MRVSSWCIAGDKHRACQQRPARAIALEQIAAACEGNAAVLTERRAPPAIAHRPSPSALAIGPRHRPSPSALAIGLAIGFLPALERAVAIMKQAGVDGPTIALMLRKIEDSGVET